MLQIGVNKDIYLLKWNFCNCLLYPYSSAKYILYVFVVLTLESLEFFTVRLPCRYFLSILFDILMHVYLFHYIDFVIMLFSVQHKMQKY